MEECVKRLADWARGRPQGPLSIELQPTNLCNLNCVMCGTRAHYRTIMRENPGFDPSRDRESEMPDQRLLEIVDESHARGAKRWLLTGGGEPLFRKAITMSMVRRIKALGMRGNMNTNAVLLGKDDIRDLVKTEWDILMVSVDSGEPPVHDRIRNVPGTFDKMSANLMRLRAEKEAKGREHPKIVFNSLLSNLNYNKIDKLIDFAQRAGCGDITLIPLIEFEGIEADLQLNEAQRKEFQGLIPGFIGLADKRGIKTNLHTLEDKGAPAAHPDAKARERPSGFAAIPCFEPYLNMVITMDGYASPCCMLGSRESLRDNRLDDIWMGPYFTEIRRKLERGELPSECSRCFFPQEVRNRELQRMLAEEPL
ncbi:MAG: radical SAM protein [archaeon]